MKKMIFIVGLFVMPMVGIAFIWLQTQPTEETVAKVPTPKGSPSITVTRTATRLPSLTPTFTMTTTASSTVTLTITPTLAQRVIYITAVHPEVVFAPSASPFPDGFQLLSEPPIPHEPLPNATYLPYPYTDFEDWVSFESDHPAMNYLVGEWIPLESQQASQGRYHYTESPDSKVSLTFVGEAVRVRYVAFNNGGVWQVLLDGQVVDVIDAYAPVGMFTGTGVYYAGEGEHTIALHNTGEANVASNGTMLALDAFQIYQPNSMTLILPAGESLNTPTTTPNPIKVIMVEAPAPPEPTVTLPAPVPYEINLMIGYDENANRLLDVNEGVRGVSARLVETVNNRVLDQAFTDERGYVNLQALSLYEVQLVVPYFNESWRISPYTTGQAQTFSLLLSPGNQPGLIP